jgi:hypothetical protein
MSTSRAGATAPRATIPTHRKLLWAAVATGIFLLSLTALGWLLERTRLVDGAYLDPDSTDRATLVSLEPAGDGSKLQLQVGACPRALVPATRGERDFRVLIAGGSFAQGTPFGCDPQDGQVRQGMTPIGGTSDWLQVMLELDHPERDIQVINLGISRARARNLVDLVDTMIELQPDLVVILAGNNDTQPPPDETHQVLADWPAYRAAHELMWPATSGGGNAGLRYDPAMMRSMAEAFERSLRDAVTALRRHGVAVMLGTLPINARWDGRMGDASVLDLPPDWKVPKPWPMIAEAILGAPLVQTCDEGGISDEQRSLLEALPCAAQARTATCAPPESAAEAWLTLADRCPTMHTRPSMNRSVQALAEATAGVHLVDVDAAFRQVGPGGLASPDMFMDYCHATWRGYHLTARTILDAIHTAGLLPAPAQPADLDPETLVELRAWQDVATAVPRFHLGAQPRPPAGSDDQPE